jgi:hypothetical protein
MARPRSSSPHVLTGWAVEDAEVAPGAQAPDVRPRPWIPPGRYQVAPGEGREQGQSDVRPRPRHGGPLTGQAFTPRAPATGAGEDGGGGFASPHDREQPQHHGSGRAGGGEGGEGGLEAAVASYRAQKLMAAGEREVAAQAQRRLECGGVAPAPLSGAQLRLRRVRAAL